MSYDRELEWTEPPSLDESRYARWTVVRAAGLPSVSWWPLARIGAVDLYLAPPGSESDAPVRSVTPLLAGKRGRRGSGDYTGVDGNVQTGGFETAAAPVAPARPYAFPSVVIDSDAIRVAVVDVSFDKLAALPSSVEGPIRVGLPRADGAVHADASRSAIAPGHGTAMAGVVLAECPEARVGLFQIPGAADAARPYLAPADLAAAVAAAVGAWSADVVLIAMSDGAWGTPSYLRDVLREAARCGRRGRGTPIFCSVGDPSRNHSRDDDSAALGADDLASQPWVHAVAACDRDGHWYRVYPGYACPGPANSNGRNGATYNRLGPAVALAALGEPHRWSEHIAADDSSQASAVAAAAAARVLGENPDLSAVELRALLALTTDVRDAVDGGRGLAAGAFNTRDRLGHNFKIGHGVVNAPAACLAAADPVCLALLATRPVPDDLAPRPAIAIARTWQAEVRRAARRGDPLARDFLSVAGRLSRLFLTSLELREALCWLARHVHGLLQAGHTNLWRQQHHGALVVRIRHAIETAREALGPEEADWAARLQSLETVFADTDAGAAVGTFLAIAFPPADIAVDGKGEPRGTALTSDAFGDRPHRRHAHGGDRGGELERAPIARPDISGSVH